MKDLPPMIVLGLMSGTSADGVDAVAARFEHQAGKLEWEVLTRRSHSYPQELRQSLLRALKPETSDVSLITQLHARVGRAYADLAAEVVAELPSVELIALSGQTIYHIPRRDPERGWQEVSTLQIGEAALVAERCRRPVMCDFRQGDMAAGGQGAPMVSFGDLLLYGEPGVNRAVHNLGGISNLTYLGWDTDNAEPEAATGRSPGQPFPRVFAFDTGPANCLMDDAAERFFGKSHDENGEVAAAGRVDEELLNRWLEHPYLELPPPKTTGRELFELSALAPPPELEPTELMATLCAFTAESIARAYREWVLPHGLDEVLLAGGGALNPALVAMIRERLPVQLRTFGELGYDARDREALAFAVMAYAGYHRQPNILPSATGARRPLVAGKLLDHGI